MVSPDPARFREQAHDALRQGDTATARALFHEAAQCPGLHSAFLQELAGSLWALYDFAGAQEVYRRAADADGLSVDACLLAAQKMFSIARFQQSAEWLEQALARRPNDPELLVMLGEIHDRANRLHEAEHCASEALRLAPGSVKATRLMAHVERRHGHLDRARSRLADHLTRFPGEQDWRLRYELAAVLDRLGAYDAAMRELFKAKAQLEPQSRKYIAVARAVHERQQAVADLLTAADWTVTRSARPGIILLCGHPRSGTTLLERILGAHPDLVTTDETGVLTREFIEPVLRHPASAQSAVEELRSFSSEQWAAGRQAYREFTEAHLGEPVGGRLLVEKDPSLTPDLPLPLQMFPDARVLYPLRDPRDICISYFFTLLPLNPISVPAVDLASTCDYCARSLQFWHRWRECIHHSWLETRYEELVTEPEQVLPRVMDFLGVPWDRRMLEFHEPSAKGVRTPTYADVAQPIYRRAVGRWRHYEKYLAPHLEALRPWLRRFDYE